MIRIFLQQAASKIIIDEKFFGDDVRWTQEFSNLQSSLPEK